MTAIGPKQHQQIATTSVAIKKKKIAQQEYVKAEQAKANQRGLDLLAKKASAEHQEGVRQEAERLSLFNLFSQINRPEPKEQETEIQTSILDENDVKKEEKKSSKEDGAGESGDGSNKSINDADHSPFAIMGASLVSNSSSQSAAAAGAMTEARLEQLQNLLSQMAAQVSVNSKRSEFIVTLDPVLFADTQLKIQLGEQGLQVDYSCGHAAETTWFGNHAAELSKRLTTALNCPVKIQSAERWPATSDTS